VDSQVLFADVGVRIDQFPPGNVGGCCAQSNVSSMLPVPHAAASLVTTAHWLEQSASSGGEVGQAVRDSESEASGDAAD
jgi:hypothetical protein